MSDLIMWWLITVGVVLLVDRGRVTRYAAGVFLLIGLAISTTWPGETMRSLIYAFG
jgi:hypothetical protein